MLQSPSVTVINLISRTAVCVLEVIIYIHSHKNFRATVCFYGRMLGCGCNKLGQCGVPHSSGTISLHQWPRQLCYKLCCTSGGSWRQEVLCEPLEQGWDLSFLVLFCDCKFYKHLQLKLMFSHAWLAVGKLLVWKVRAESIWIMLQVNNCQHSLKQNGAPVLEGTRANEVCQNINKTYFFSFMQIWQLGCGYTALFWLCLHGTAWGIMSIIPVVLGLNSDLFPLLAQVSLPVDTACLALGIRRQQGAWSCPACADILIESGCDKHTAQWGQAAQPSLGKEKKCLSCSPRNKKIGPGDRATF